MLAAHTGRDCHVRAAQIASTPDALVAFMAKLPHEIAAIGLGARPLSHRLHKGLAEAGLEAALKAMPIKTDRRDAEGNARLLQMGRFRPVHGKSVSSEQMRARIGRRRPSRQSAPCRHGQSVTTPVLLCTDLCPLGMGVAAALRDLSPCKPLHPQFIRVLIALAGLDDTWLCHGTPTEQCFCVQLGASNARLHSGFAHRRVARLRPGSSQRSSISVA